MLAPIAFLTIALGFFVELGLLGLANPAHFAGKFGQGEAGAEDEVKLLASRCLSLLGFTGTSIAFLLGQLPDHPALDGPILILGLAFVFFLAGFKLDSVGATRRFYFEAQEHSLAYGLIALAVALAIAYGTFSTAFASFVFVIPTVPIGWHLVDLVRDLKFYRVIRNVGVPKKT